MNFRLDNILEDWASHYLPLSHDKEKGSKDKRFFRIKTINSENEWMRNTNTVKSPCMLFSVLIDAQANGNNKTVNYLYTIYFASKAISRGLAKNVKQDDENGTDQQLDMDDMVQDLIAYLHKIKSDGKCPITNKEFDAPTREALKGLQLDKVEWASIPVKYNEWHIMGVSLEQITPRLLCVNQEKYK